MLHLKYKSLILASIQHDEESLDEFYRVRNEFRTENAAFGLNYYSDKYVYAISPLGQYPIGLTESICKKCIDLSIQVDIDQKLLELSKPSILNEAYKPIPVPNKKYAYRDYQESLIKSLLNNGRGIVVSPTRSGKSLVIAGLINNIFDKTSSNELKLQNILIIVPNVQLVDQFYDDLNEYGLGDICNIQQFTATVMNKKNAKVKVDPLNIYIANAQYLLGHGNELPEIDVVFCDEVHTIAGKGSAISKLVKKIPIKHKFGCTGTLPKDQHGCWQIEGIFGPVLDEIAIKDLQDKKILAGVEIYNLKFIHKKKIDFRHDGLSEDGENSMSDIFEAAQRAYAKEAQYLGMHEYCNGVSLKLVAKLISEHADWNALVLFDYTEQGHALFEQLDWKNKHYVDGAIKIEDRKNTITAMNESGGNITIAQSKVFSTGLTISRINVIVLMTTSSACTKIIQSIGRGLRRQNKEKIIIFDISHNYKYSEKHFQERMALYDEFYNLKYKKDYFTKEIPSND